MPVSIENDSLRLHIYLPGEKYRGSRFDWTGQIAQITLNGKHTFCTVESLEKPGPANPGEGLFNEFGIDIPVGYDDCPVGEQFPKLGIGLLTRQDTAPYFFYNNYPVSPARFSQKVEKQRAEFVCAARLNRGYAYTLKKNITLRRDGFVIGYELINRGTREIATNEYVHNFLSLNNRLIDGRYALHFSFPLDPENFAEVVNPQNVVSFGKDTVSWQSRTHEQFFFSFVNTRYNKNIAWTLEHRDEGIGIRESVDFSIARLNLWGWGHVVGPEIFYQFHLPPDQKVRWQRNYTVYEL